MRAKALKNLQKTGSIRESETRNSGKGPTSCPPKAVGVVDGDVFGKEAVRDRPCLGEVKFCALPKRQYCVQPMINGSKDGGKNGERATRGTKGLIPMNRVFRIGRVQKRAECHSGLVRLRAKADGQMPMGAQGPRVRSAGEAGTGIKRR